MCEALRGTEFTWHLQESSSNQTVHIHIPAMYVQRLFDVIKCKHKHGPCWHKKYRLKPMDQSQMTYKAGITLPDITGPEPQLAWGRAGRPIATSSDFGWLTCGSAVLQRANKDSISLTNSENFQEMHALSPPLMDRSENNDHTFRIHWASRLCNIQHLGEWENSDQSGLLPLVWSATIRLLNTAVTIDEHHPHA